MTRFKILKLFKFRTTVLRKRQVDLIRPSQKLKIIADPTLLTNLVAKKIAEDHQGEIPVIEKTVEEKTAEEKTAGEKTAEKISLVETSLLEKSLCNLKIVVKITYIV